MTDQSDGGILGGLRRLLPSKEKDAGSGELDDYDYNLRPKKKGAVIRVAQSDGHQDELRTVLDLGAEEVWAMVARRGPEEERTDAPMPVRLFTGTRVSGIVGIVPRGLEAPVDTAVARLTDEGRKPRIPAAVTETRHGIRVDLLMGAT